MEDASAPGTVTDFDRSADERTAPDLIARLAADTETRVLLIDGDRAPVDAAGGLVLMSVDAAREIHVAIAVAENTHGDTASDPTAHDASTRGDVAATAPLGDETATDHFVFLGRRGGVALLLSAVPGAAELTTHPSTDRVSPRPATWVSLRALHPALGTADGALLLEAVSLARWVLDAGYCAFCGAEAKLTTAGWARICTACGREHFPRTDPAVIVAVTDGDRLLLGSNAMWEQRRYSCFAGFVEAGESLEEAVCREVLEESGIEVEHVAYAGSQAWPFPRSLMLGFRAHARDARTAHPDGEEILDVRWFTRAEIRAAYAGESDLILPGKPSIAHELISTWAAESEADEPDPMAGERA